MFKSTKLAPVLVLKLAAIITVSVLSLVILACNIYVNFVKNYPNFFNYIPKITFGLDIKGGSQMVLEADVETLIQQRMASSLKELKNSLWIKRLPHGEISLLEGNTILIKKPMSGSLSSTEISDIVSKLAFEGLTTTNSSSGLLINLSKEAEMRIKNSALERTLDIIRRRIDSSGTKEVLVQRIGGQKILIQVPGVENPEEIKKMLGKVAKLTFHLMHPIEPFSIDQKVEVGSDYISIKCGKEGYWCSIKAEPELDGEHLVDARVAINGFDVVISFRLDKYGTGKFAKVTENNISRPLAIVLDDVVITAPTINVPITNGTGIITGSFSKPEAAEMAAMLRSGALPTKITLIEESTIGPSLGATAIKNASLAGIVGLVLVVCFMLAYYRTLGLVASFALLINLSTAVSVMAIFGITVTLPGLAGLVLMLGMSVDLNVLINERIRDELSYAKRDKKSIEVAEIIKSGFSGAWSGILDSNATTALSAATMLFFGSVFIKGFATGLITGISCSMFSAIVFTKMAIDFLFVKLGFKLKLTAPLQLK